MIIPRIVLPIVIVLLTSLSCGAQSTEWGTQGNAGTTSNCFIGTTDPSALKIRTGNVEQMVVKTDGVVEFASLRGVGTALVGSDPNGALLRLDSGLDSLFDCSVKLWRANGNFITPDCFIGSTNAQPLRMYTDNAERMRVTEAGLVGIGTVAPAASLHVQSNAGAASLRLQSGNLQNAPEIMFAGGGGASAAAAELCVLRGGYNAALGRPEFSVRVNPGAALTGTVEVMRIDHATAEVKTRLGVGGPAHANDRFQSTGFGRFVSPSIPGSYVRIGHNGVDAVIEHATAGTNASTGNRLLINPGGNRTDFGGTVVMAQNLGLGTSNFNDAGNGKSYRLSVDGRIRAQEVKVYTGWADHVFEAGYALMPLRDVEAYIQKEGHLPGMPSAAEVAADGVELGATQALLLEKVEELTLHMIRLEKENAALRKTVEEMK